MRDPEIGCAQTAEHRFSGDRDQVRENAVQTALNGVLELIAG
jgi:nicotinamide mononucleotide (NMN) deamidase PncC